MLMVLPLTYYIHLDINIDFVLLFLLIQAQNKIQIK